MKGTHYFLDGILKDNNEYIFKVQKYDSTSTF